MLSDADFIRAHTKAKVFPFLPEITLHIADEITPLWTACETRSGRTNTSPPFWAFAWPGGLALARYALDHAEIVHGLVVMDFASGSGLGSIAFRKAGCSRVIAVDIDPLAQTATQVNAEANDVIVEIEPYLDMEKAPVGIDVIFAGDVCYEQTMSHRVMRWLRLCAGAGIRVFIGDPGRAYAPEDGLLEVARYVVPTTQELEDRDARDVTVWQLVSENNK